MRAAICLVAALLAGCQVLPREGEVGSMQWVFDNADHFVYVAELDLERCQATGKRTCIPEENALHKAKMMQDAAGYSAALKAGFIK